MTPVAGPRSPKTIDSRESIRRRNASFIMFEQLVGDRDRGGVKSPKIRGGGEVKILNFRGSRNLTLFYRVSIENPQFGGQKSKLCKDNFRGEFPPPPLTFGTF